MKRIILTILVLIALAFCVWLIVQRPAPTQIPEQKIVLPIPPKPTNVIPTSAISNTPIQPTPPQSTPITNAFVRPASINEVTWNRVLINRQVILSENQPIEFYARIIDQNQQPIKGAKLKLKISRMDETMFVPANYIHWDPAKAVQDITVELLSDVNGWVCITNKTGQLIQINDLSKDGYSWTMPPIGSFGYGPERAVGYAGMEDAFNPNKGYIFHLQKIEAK